MGKGKKLAEYLEMGAENHVICTSNFLRDAQTFSAWEKPDWYTELRAISHKSHALNFQTCMAKTIKPLDNVSSSSVPVKNKEHSLKQLYCTLQPGLLLLSEFARDHPLKEKHSGPSRRTWEKDSDGSPKIKSCYSEETLPIQSDKTGHD